MEITWRPIPGLADGWQVSNQGDVKLNWEDVNIFTHDGYFCVALRPSVDYVGPPFLDRSARYARVHELVLLAFHGPRPVKTYLKKAVKFVPVFLDGDETNVAAANIKWGTVKEQRAHYRVVKPSRKLSLKDVESIVPLADAGVVNEHIATILNLPVALVNHAVAGLAAFAYRSNGEPYASRVDHK